MYWFKRKRQKMSIMVKSQKELDKIPLDTNVGIFINFGTGKNLPL